MISVGYVLIEGALRQEWMHSSVPATVLTPTSCVCRLHPPDVAVTWTGSLSEGAKYLNNLGLRTDYLGKFLSSLNQLIDDSLWGADGVFVSCDAAKEFWKHWFKQKCNVRLYELSLPRDLLPNFRETVAPPIPNAIPSGKYLAAQRAASAVAGTDVLGFEVWGVQAWGDMHTSVCYGVRDDFVHILGAEFNDLGLLKSLDVARQAADLNNSKEGGSVGDSTWFPIQIAEIGVCT